MFLEAFHINTEHQQNNIKHFNHCFFFLINQKKIYICIYFTLNAKN